MTPEQESGTYEVARRGRFKPNIVAAPGSMLAVLTHVSLGVGVSVIPSVVRKVVTLPGVAFDRIAGDPFFSEVAAVFRGSASSPTVKHFVRQIQSTQTQVISPLDWGHSIPPA
ncbi:LysR substrate-binding domain-containing protein [Brucella intermedia]|uniref:LysR substrate-binding domain-containing protein n=1 Tax=Brucella intermedia TaxID=94625 RepID=UPI00396A5399